MANGISVLRAQYSQSFTWWQGTMAGVTEEVAHYEPGGAAVPIAAHIGHMVSGLDFLLLGAVAGRQPLVMTNFAGKSGISELPPRGDWGDWGRRVKVNIPAVQEYSQAVFEAIDAYLASLSDDDLDSDKPMDFGTYTVGWWLNTMLLNNYCHTGEIACIKGLQGLRGYPA